MKRKPKLVQVIPDAPPATFQVHERKPGDSRWHFRLRDAILGDEPEFEYRPPKKGCLYTTKELAVYAASEMNEGRGQITATEFADGVPVFSAVFASNGRQVFCLWSTDRSRAEPISVEAVGKLLRRR